MSTPGRAAIFGKAFSNAASNVASGSCCRGASCSVRNAVLGSILGLNFGTLEPLISGPSEFLPKPILNSINQMEQGSEHSTVRLILSRVGQGAYNFAYCGRSRACSSHLRARITGSWEEKAFSSTPLSRVFLRTHSPYTCSEASVLPNSAPPASRRGSQVLLIHRVVHSAGIYLVSFACARCRSGTPDASGHDTERRRHWA